MQWLKLDFNINLAPPATEMLTVEYGPDVRSASPSKGLTITETGAAIQVGPVCPCISARRPVRRLCCIR